MRDYGKIVRRIESLKGEHIFFRVLGEIEGQPIYGVRLSRNEELPTALVMGGTHGNEPAGVQAALTFLERDVDDWLEALNFEVIPCLNPHGYVHDARHNAQDIDINWAYRRNDVPEVQVMRDFVAGRRFEFVLDFHEDWESPGYYLYELRRGAELVGPEVMHRVGRICSLNTSPVIEGYPAKNGLLSPDPNVEVARRGAGIPLVMYFEHTDHLLTSESPSGEDIGVRVAAHMATLEAVVEAHILPIR